MISRSYSAHVLRQDALVPASTFHYFPNLLIINTHVRLVVDGLFVFDDENLRGFVFNIEFMGNTIRDLPIGNQIQKVGFNPRHFCFFPTPF